MEDEYLMELDINEDHVSIFGVFDGHGGAEVAKFVGKYFIDALRNNSFFTSRDYKKALEITFLKMDEMLLDPRFRPELNKFSKHEEDSFDDCDDEINSGCTGNVVLIAQNKIFVANAGDSRSVLYRGDESSFNYLVIPLSFDHKPDDEIELNRILNAGGKLIQGRIDGNLNLSRSIGDFEYKKNEKLPADQQKVTAFPDVIEYEINQNDRFIVIGCDGIWDGKENEEIMELVKKKIYDERNSIDKAVEDLLEHVIAKDTNCKT